MLSHIFGHIQKKTANRPRFFLELRRAERLPPNSWDPSQIWAYFFIHLCLLLQLDLCDSPWLTKGWSLNMVNNILYRLYVYMFFPGKLSWGKDRIGNFSFYNQPVLYISGYWFLLNRMLCWPSWTVRRIKIAFSKQVEGWKHLISHSGCLCWQKQSAVCLIKIWHDMLQNCKKTAI